MNNVTVLAFVALVIALILSVHALIFFGVARWFTTSSNGKHTGAPWFVLYYDWLNERGEAVNIFADKNLTQQQREEKRARQARARKRRQDRKARRKARRKTGWLS